MAKKIEFEMPSWVRSGRVPCLDGFRAISIILVILAHLQPQIHAQLSRQIPTPNGHLGVTFFFVISGFLITLLMLRERERTHKISLKGFYIRRVLRIFPVFFTYLGIIFIFQKMGCITINWKLTWISYLASLPNLYTNSDVGHLWSLSVEEHFYFIWPFLLAKLKLEKSKKLLFVYLLSLPLLRFIVWTYLRRWIDIDFCSVTQMGSIAMGCLGAFMVYGMALNSWTVHLQQNAPRYVLASCVAFVGSLVLGGLSGKYGIALYDPINSFCMMVFMLGIMYSEKSLLFKIACVKPVTAIGVLSYSLYLWQQPLTGKGFAVNVSNYLIVNIILIVILSLLSYHFVEMPFLKWKEKYREKT
jgi:peptidoglycan/LPS O-acetylase OafA/YrhL